MTIEWRSEWTIPSVTGVVALGVGVATGYGLCFLKSKHTIQILEQALDVLGAAIEEDATEAIQAEELLTLSEAFEKIADTVVTVSEVINDIGPGELTVDPPESVSVFVDPDPSWDYEEEQKLRTSESPYVIHTDEYYGNETGYGQSTLTYYAGDDILCDEEDVPIYNPNSIVGPLPFGKGSSDPNVVHIRNEHLEAEYEVIQDSGFFSVEVLGQEFETPTEKTVLQKFRDK